jgi:peptidoglycan/xylan/chitin deacetylase (PgdA/CDA1 family)
MPSQIKRIFIVSVSALVFFYDRISDLIRWLQKKRNIKCVILYYHGVGPEQKNRFVRQMNDLVRWVKPIALDRLCSQKSEGNYCAVTFDDGLNSVREHALPAMKYHSIPAALFVPSACLGQLPPWLNQNERDADAVMTSKQLKNLDRTSVLVGSHGRYHRNLLKISTEEATKEIFQSKKELEDILGDPITSISFPHGAFNQRHLDMAVQAGYRHAYSIMPELVEACSNRFLMGRVKVDPSDWRIEFLLKLFGAYRWLPLAFGIKRRIYSCLTK